MNRKKGIFIFIICYMAYTSIYIARLNLSMTSPELISNHLMDASQIGILGSVFSVVYAIGRLANGSLSDKAPPWLMISAGLIIVGISNIIIGFFPPFIEILLFWGLNAYAQSMLWSSILCIISCIYDERTAKKKMTYMVTTVATGNILGIIFNMYIITHIGLAYAFIIPGTLTIIFSILIAFTTRKIGCPEPSDKKHISMHNLFTDKTIIIAFVPSMLHGVMKDNISLWMTVYFVNKFGINLSQSAYFVLFIPIIGFVGRVLYPICYRLCDECEHKVSMYSFILCAISAIPLSLGGFSPVIAVICMSIIYASVSLVNTSMLSILPVRYIKSGNVASVSGIMDFATYLGAGLSAFAYGFIIKNFGYSAMFASWSVISVISVFMLRILMTSDN